MRTTWSRDGRELFYFEGTLGTLNTRLIGITVAKTPEFSFEPPRVLIDGGLVTYPNVPGVYDASLDGERFLMTSENISSSLPLETHQISKKLSLLRRNL